MPYNRIHRYLRHGTLPQFAVFEASARLRSFTRAAEELHLAQPTVSAQIKKLTETVGAPLFEQIGKQIFLTETGRRTYTHCQALFHTLDSLEDTMADLRSLDSGNLCLAVTTAANCFAARMLAGFGNRYPGIDVSLRIHNRRDLIARLASNDDELFIFVNPPADREIVHQAILVNPLVVFARADDPLARERALPFARVAAQPFLMREPGSGTRMVVDRVFAQHGLAPRIRMEFSSNEAIRQAIIAGLGISILPRDTLGHETEQSALVALNVVDFPLAQQWHFVYPVGRQLSRAARAFMDFVREETREPPFERTSRTIAAHPPQAPAN